MARCKSGIRPRVTIGRELTADGVSLIKGTDYAMNQCYSLPSEQRRVQRLVALFNKDEQLWESLEGKRRLRRTLFPGLSKKRHKQLGLPDFAKACQAQGCVGLFEEP